MGFAEPAAGTCPVAHGGGAVRRSRADDLVRSVLRIRDRQANVSDAAVYRSFRRSMLISATRCTLTYVIFPFLLPAISFGAGVGPVIGIVIGLVAMICDVYTIRRFFQVDHRLRWPVSFVAAGVLTLVGVLVTQDVIHLVT